MGHSSLSVYILQLSLSDCVSVVVAAVVVFRLHLEGRRHGDKDVDRERIDVVVDDKGLVGETNKHKHKHKLDCSCN